MADAAPTPSPPRPRRTWRDRTWLAPGLLYVVGLGIGQLVTSLGSDADRTTQLAWSSTNLANLARHPIGALIASAFVTDGAVLGWMALALAGLGVAARALGALPTTLLVAVAHVVGTLISEGLVAYRIHTGLAPASDSHILDVGASYVVVCALVAGLAYGTWPGRFLCAAGMAILSPSLFEGLPHAEVSSVGHVCSVAIALALGFPLRRRRTRAPLTSTYVPGEDGR